MVISPSQASRRFLANAAAGDGKLRLICNNLIEFVIRQIVELHGATVRPRVRDRRQPRVHIGRCGFRHFVAPRGRRPRIAQSDGDQKSSNGRAKNRSPARAIRLLKTRLAASRRCCNSAPTLPNPVYFLSTLEQDDAERVCRASAL
jgi:hypothetical protein